ncbi:MAG: indole-3-glycerol phosphate synthase TrpC [Deltaproteobacteria bacterium]|nr:indole-3-glycerol phosphate synthase TrpC [Deltaproteobacteria bacterium]
MFLEKIIKIKREEVDKKKTLLPPEEVEERVRQLPPPRDFMKAFSRNESIVLIAEIKRASPSLGMIREDIDLCQMINQYQAGGASALSVLTESNFFKGGLSDLRQVREGTALPVLQKDFIIDPFQIFEGRAAGADAVLLIAAILERGQLKDFVKLTMELQMTPLVEVHDEYDLEKISNLVLPLIGINNRDLKTFEVDLKTTLRLKRRIPPRTKVISESGIKSSGDVRLLREAGVDGILVGEILMRSSDPASKIKELLKG